MGTTKADHPELRTITHNSSGTSSVSIPIGLIRDLGWRKGQKVMLVRKGRELIVRPHTAKN